MLKTNEKIENSNISNIIQLLENDLKNNTLVGDGEFISLAFLGIPAGGIGGVVAGSFMYGIYWFLQMGRTNLSYKEIIISTTIMSVLLWQIIVINAAISRKQTKKELKYLSSVLEDCKKMSSKIEYESNHFNPPTEEFHNSMLELAEKLDSISLKYELKLTRKN